MASMLVLLSAVSILQSLASAHPHSNEKPRNSKLLVSRNFHVSDLYANWPSYSQLPLHPSYPTKAAWGVWGADDVEGALNHITPETIQAAAAEIQVGKAINLNLGLEQFVTPINTARKPTVHLFQPGDGYIDDVITVNTQVSTQFDGLRHFPYSIDSNVTTYQWYNDLIQDFDEVVGPAPSTVLGIQQAAQKGIAGRGILLDWAGWAENQNLSYSAFAGRGITVGELDEVAAWQGLATEWSRPGDILLIRTGWGKAYNSLSDHERAILPWQDGLESIGMLASDESLEWLWEKKLALVGADNPAFESLPFNKTIDGTPRSLHQVFIGGWGQSIVEFLDVEVLAETLHQLGRSTFFLTLQNLNVVSGIASPPNALAVL